MAEFEFVDRSYGKSWVKLLYIIRDGNVHSIREYEVSTLLTLNSDKDYTKGDSSDIIATDTQKNTVYLLAKKHGVRCPEQFAILVAKHFLQTYSWVVRAEVTVEALVNWNRVGSNHVHAFISEPKTTRWAKVVQDGRGSPAKVTGGLNGLRILKTTQSGFYDFVQDAYTSLKYANDRVFSTIVESSWTYSTLKGVDFDAAFARVEKAILENFAGPPDKGHYSASVQQTLYNIQVSILTAMPQVEEVVMAMPNKHYFPVDLSKFPKSVGGSTNNNEVFMPVDKPSGMIKSTLARKNFKAKL